MSRKGDELNSPGCVYHQIDSHEGAHNCGRRKRHSPGVHEALPRLDGDAAAARAGARRPRRPLAPGARAAAAAAAALPQPLHDQPVHLGARGKG